MDQINQEEGKVIEEVKNKIENKTNTIKKSKTGLTQAKFVVDKS